MTYMTSFENKNVLRESTFNKLITHKLVFKTTLATQTLLTTERLNVLNELRELVLFMGLYSCVGQILP